MNLVMVEDMVDFLNCEVGKTSFSYLGLKVGLNHINASSWTHMLDKIRKRLAAWSGKYISFGRPITLIQAVLSAMPIYSLSLYLLPDRKSVV